MSVRAKKPENYPVLVQIRPSDLEKDKETARQVMRISAITHILPENDERLKPGNMGCIVADEG